MRILKLLKGYYTAWKVSRAYKKKIRELKNRDPFNYKNF